MTGVNCSPRLILRPSQADFMIVSWPFMLSSFTAAMRCAAPVQLLMLLVSEA